MIKDIEGDVGGTDVAEKRFLILTPSPPRANSGGVCMCVKWIKPPCDARNIRITPLEVIKWKCVGGWFLKIDRITLKGEFDGEELIVGGVWGGEKPLKKGFGFSSSSQSWLARVSIKQCSTNFSVSSFPGEKRHSDLRGVNKDTNNVKNQLLEVADVFPFWICPRGHFSPLSDLKIKFSCRRKGQPGREREEKLQTSRFSSCYDADCLETLFEFRSVNTFFFRQNVFKINKKKSERRKSGAYTHPNEPAWFQKVPFLLFFFYVCFPQRILVLRQGKASERVRVSPRLGAKMCWTNTNVAWGSIGRGEEKKGKRKRGEARASHNV